MAKKQPFLTLRSLQPKKYLIVTGGLIALAVFLHIAVEVGRVYFGSEEITSLDLDSESSFGTWLSIIMMVIAAFAAYELSFHKNTFTLHWKLFAFFLLGLSLDDEMAIHERSGQYADALNLPQIGGRSWLIWGILILVIAVCFFWRFFWQMRKPLRNMLIVGFAIFFLGAFGIEGTTDTWAALAKSVSGGYGDKFHYAVALEEGLEMLGMLLFSYALIRELDYTARHAVR